MLARKALAGTAGAPKEYVEDVFSTYLWDGNATARNIVNGIDLSGEGGMVWTKYRNTTNNHRLYDTARGATKEIYTSLTNAESTASQSLTAFNADGFSLGTGQPNENTATVVGWTFRKAEKFFDVVTYTGNGSNRTISHNLGSVPGCIIIKDTTNAGSAWAVYHRSVGNTKYLWLHSTGAEGTSSGYWNNTTPTSTEFTVGTNGNVNQNGATFVAYLFAHDAGGFGDAGSDSIIKCGSFTTSGGAATVTLDWEPQWLLIKETSTTGNWKLIDNMRGAFAGSDAKALYANTTAAEFDLSPITPTATGFSVSGLLSAQDFIYIAIRRGPMKTPTSGTSVYTPIARSGNSTATTVTGVGFAPDLVFEAARTNSGGNNWVWFDRLRGGAVGLSSDNTGAEFTNSAVIQSDSLSTTMDGFRIQTANPINASGNTYVYYPLKRAPGFFDVVCYTGTGSATTVTHNLGVAPELMIVKRRDTTNAWAVYANNDNTDYLVLNTTAATADDNTYWNDTSPTSSVFSVGTNNATNASGSTYVAYLFASVNGVSKVGSYTGNGSSVTVTTDFQPRFVLVKRTDSTGNWIVGDSARGLVAGNDPYLLLNSTAAEDTDEDWVDVTSTSFTINETAANANVNTATYIYLAIA
jgi:hypothetical protein